MESLGADGGRWPTIKESLPASERPKSKAVSDGFRRFSSPRRSVPRVWRARMSRQGRTCPAQRQPQLHVAFPQLKTIDGSRREGNQSIGSELIQKSLRSLRSQSMESARSRCAGPMPLLPTHPCPPLPHVPPRAPLVPYHPSRTPQLPHQAIPQPAGRDAVPHGRWPGACA
jgi:hypothetical protein